MEPASRDAKPIASVSKNLDRYRNKLVKKMGKIESRTTTLTIKTLSKLKTFFKEHAFEGTISPPSPEVVDRMNNLKINLIGKNVG